MKAEPYSQSLVGAYTQQLVGPYNKHPVLFRLKKFLNICPILVPSKFF